MTKRAQLADGTVLEFPDETTDQVMDQVVRSHMARAQQEADARTRSGDPMTPGSVAGAIAGRAASRPLLPPRYVGRAEAQGNNGIRELIAGGPDPALQAERDRYLTRNYSPFGAGVAQVSQGATFGFGDEIEGGLQAFGAAGSEVLQGRPQNALRAGRRAYEDTVDTTRLFVERGRREAPITSTVNEIGGGFLLPGGVVQSGGRQAASAGRNIPLFLGQTRDAAALGAAGGYAYGFGSDTGDLASRAQAGSQGAAVGAGLGALAPTAANAIGATSGAIAPAWQRLERSLPRVAPRAEQGVGAFGAQMFGGGRNLRAVPPAPPQGPRIPPVAAATIDRLAERNRMTPDQVEAAFAEARRNPQGQVVADLFGDTGTRTTRAVAQAPGQTGGRAAEVARERFQAAPDRILNELNRRLAVAETPEQAMASLERQYAEASRDLYTPLFQRPMEPEVRQTAAEFLRRYSNNETYRDAARRATRLFETDRANGMVEGGIDENFARYLHYLKMGVDDAIRDAPRAGIQATEMRGLREMRRRILTAVDNAIPGYREARNRWSTISSAQEALEEGSTLITQNSSSIRQRLAEMTDFERYHARVGFANSIANRIGLRGSVNGNRNVAEALGSPEMQRRVRAMFDTEEQAADFLDTLNQQNMLMRNAGQWGTGSQTYSNAMHGADDALNLASDLGVNVATGNLGGAARRLVQGGANAITLGAVERANNVRGEALLRRVDNEDSAAFARAVVEELRRRAAARQANTSTSQAGAVAASSQQDAVRR